MQENREDTNYIIKDEKMKNGACSTTNPTEIKITVKEFYEPLDANNFVNLYESDKFLQRQMVLMFNQKERDNPNSPIFAWMYHSFLVLCLLKDFLTASTFWQL